MKYTQVRIWLPKPLYQYFPTIYVLMAILFFYGSYYISFQHPLSPLYMASGGFCLGAGIIIFVLRLTYKNNGEVQENKDT